MPFLKGRKLQNFFPRNTEPISTEIGTKHQQVIGIQYVKDHTFPEWVWVNFIQPALDLLGLLIYCSEMFLK